jgi:hypothetical protein
MTIHKRLRAAVAIAIAFVSHNGLLNAQNTPSPSPRQRPPVASQGSPGGGIDARSVPGRAEARLIAPAKMETRSSYVTLGGRLSPIRRIDQTAGVSGIVSGILVGAGSWVRTGDAILSIARDLPGESYMPVIIRARISGRVSDIKPALGGEVGSGTVVVSLIDDSSFTMEAMLSDRDADRIRALNPRGISARSADGAVISGAVSGISLEPDYATGLFTARFLFPLQKGARVGLVLYIDLPVSEVRGVFLDRSLIQRRFGKSFLWLLGNNDKLSLKEVQTGALFDQAICVTGGIDEGNQLLMRLTGKETEGMDRESWESDARALPPAASGPGPQGGGPR